MSDWRKYTKKNTLWVTKETKPFRLQELSILIDKHYKNGYLSCQVIANDLNISQQRVARLLDIYDLRSFYLERKKSLRRLKNIA